MNADAKPRKAKVRSRPTTAEGKALSDAIASMEARVAMYRRWQPWLFAFGLLLGAVAHAALAAGVK